MMQAAIHKQVPVRLELATMIYHVVVAMVLLPATIVLGEFVNYALIPYVVYLVWREDVQYYPALIVLCATGSTLAVLILVLMLIKVITRIGHFQQTNTHWLVVWLLAPLPFLLWVAGVKFFSLGEGFAASIIHLQFYLSLVPFLYGMLLSATLSGRMPYALFGLFIAAQAYYPIIVQVFETALRIKVFSAALLLIVGVFISAQYLMRQLKTEIGQVLTVLSLFYLGLHLTGLLELKFTLLFAVLIGSSILYFTNSPDTWRYFDVLYLKSGYLALLVAMFVLSITFAKQYGVVGNISELSYTDLGDLPQLLQYKLFGDRGLLWASILMHLEQTSHWLPPYVVESYARLIPGGGILDDTTFGAHNIPLELLRQYGFLVGVICTALYLVFVRLGFSFFTLKNQNIHYRMLVAVALGLNIAAGFSGMFVLMANHSVVNMGIVGMAFGTYLARSAARSGLWRPGTVRKWTVKTTITRMVETHRP